MRICFIVARNSSDSKVKPLLKFKETNQTVIQTICNNVIQSKLINEIIVITDNDNVKNHVSSFIKKCMVYPDLPSDNLECINLFLKKYMSLSFNYNTIINIDINEIYLNTDKINLCIQNYISKSASDKLIKCSTLHSNLGNDDSLSVVLNNKSIIKLLLDKNNNIMFATRNQKPFDSNSNINYFHHIGILVIDKNYLLNELYNGVSNYQQEENITWLKILEDSYRISSVLLEDHISMC